MKVDNHKNLLNISERDYSVAGFLRSADLSVLMILVKRYSISVVRT